MEAKNKGLLQARYTRNRNGLRKKIDGYLKRRQAHRILKFRLAQVTKGEIRAFQIRYQLRDDQIKKDGLLDGIYVIMTNLNQKRAGKYLVSAEDLIQGYRGRMKIERGFKYLKSFVEIRPIYHHREERIKAHVLICILGYLLSNTVEHLVRRKKNFEELTAEAVYGFLGSSQVVELQVGKEKRLKLTVPSEEQIKLTNLLANKELLNEDTLQRLR